MSPSPSTVGNSVEPELPPIAKAGLVATFIVSGAFPLASYALRHLGLVRLELIHPLVWVVSFALVLAIGLATLVMVNRAANAVRVQTGRKPWAMIRSALVMMIVGDAMLTGGAFFGLALASG